MSAMGGARIFAVWGQSQRHRGQNRAYVLGASSYMGTGGGAGGMAEGKGAAALFSLYPR